MASPLDKIIHFIAAGLICFTPAYISLSFKEQNKSIPAFHKSDADRATDIKGYRDIIFYDGKFLAVGTDGRIDYINNSGERTPVINTCTNNLNCVISEDQIMVVAGDNGTILFSSDGQVFTKVESGTDKNINGITSLVLRYKSNKFN